MTILLGMVIRSLGAKYRQYIDGTHLCFSIASESGEAVEVTVVEWIRERKLRLNPGKMKAS